MALMLKPDTQEKRLVNALGQIADEAKTKELGMVDLLRIVFTHMPHDIKESQVYSTKEEAMKFLMTLLMASFVFLVCDPYPATIAQPDYFLIVMGSQSLNVGRQLNTDKSVQLHWDFSPYVNTGLQGNACAYSSALGQACSTFNIPPAPQHMRIGP